MGAGCAQAARRFLRLAFFTTWRRARARANLDDVRIHDLRQSFASCALALGDCLLMIGKLLGHTLVQSTVRYAHLANESVTAVIPAN